MVKSYRCQFAQHVGLLVQISGNSSTRVSRTLLHWPAPAPFRLEAPSVYKVHASLDSPFVNVHISGSAVPTASWSVRLTYRMRACLPARSVIKTPLTASRDMAKDRSADLDKKHFKAASFPLRLCISLRVFGDYISDTAFVFLGFALMPLDVTIYPKNFPSATPKEHFLGFSFMLIFLRL
ncbi:hypothetical protein Tco_1544944 [Tanacetum coccineum]